MILKNIARLPRCLALGAVLLSGGQLVAQTTVTFDKVLEYVELGADSAKIAKLVQASPTKFVLGAEQVRKLQQAGATEELLAAIQKQGLPVENGSDIADFVVILDCSGSMNDRLLDGTSKWQAARQAAIELIKSVPEGRSLSFIAYGLDAQRQCSSVDVIRPLSPLTSTDKANLMLTIEHFQAVGHTPITRSLQLASKQLENASGMSSVVLITDGMETCHADPVAEAAKLVASFQNLQVSVQVIGFCMGDREAAQVAQIAKAGHGTYYDAKNSNELIESVRKVQKKIVTPPVVETVNLAALSPIERLLVEQLNDGDMDVREAAAKAIKDRNVVSAVPALVKLISNAPWGGGLSGDSDRNAAIEAVLELAPAKADAAIRGALCSDQWKIRYWAACAIDNHRISAAVPAAEERLLAMQENDISTTIINGSDEANMLFEVVQELAPDRLEVLVVKLMKSPVRSVRAWATSKLSEVK